MLLIVLFSCIISLAENTGSEERKLNDKIFSEVKSRRKLLQPDYEAIRFSTTGCNINIQDCSADVCDDKVPLGADFDCQTYSQLDLCSIVGDEFCRISCGKCGCVDKILAGTDCETVVASGKCEAQGIKGIYCAKSCGTCDTSTPVPAPAPPKTTATSPVPVLTTPSFNSTGCEDIPPEGAQFSCSTYATLGICDSILSTSCQLSCNRCSNGSIPNDNTNPQISMDIQISPTPTPTPTPTIEPAQSTSTTSKVNKKRTCKSSSYKFVAAECRDGVDTTISGGDVATPPSYMISLQFPKNFGNLNIYGDCYEHFCGGSLIAPNLVLTAAHCVTGNKFATEIFGTIGSDGRIFQSVYAAHAPDCRHDQGFERIGVFKAYIFPGYSSNTFAGDVAVLELYGSLQGPYIQYQQAFGLSLKDNEDLLFMGYGKQSATEKGYGNAPFVTITMDYMADEFCRATMEWNNNTDLIQVFSENSMVCGMVASQGSTCKGHSGGPLVKKGATQKDDILVGIDSYRETLSCGIGSLTIFAELGFEEIMFWVDDIVQQHAFASGGIDWAKPTKLNGSLEESIKESMCQDDLLPYTENCSIVLENEICEDVNIRGKFCQQSCGYCELLLTDGQKEDVQKLDECEDILIPGTNCSYIVEQGLCQEPQIRGQFCAYSCGECNLQNALVPIQENIDSGDTENEIYSTCEDVFLPGMQDCKLVLQNDLCNETEIRGVYCKKSCGFCDSIPDDNCELEESLDCDVSGLLKFKESLVSGEYLLSSWNGSNPCSWKYVTCSRGNTPRVTKIEMDFYNTAEDDVMSGSIVPEFSKLRYLQQLKLDSSKLRGELFKEFSVLKNLEWFEMVRLDLEGSFPPEYSTWTNLVNFFITYNSITGKYPIEWTTWTKLNTFVVGGNRVQGTLPPEYSIFSNMELFDVGRCFLQGSIPAEYSTWKKVLRITLAQNSLTGTLPPQLSTMQKINDLFIADNQFTGTLPETYSEWKQCKQFLIFENVFSGILPVEYSEMVRMAEFHIDDNKFSGSLPVQYSTMKRLKEFQATRNNIYPVIPTEWSQLEQFADVDV